MVEASQSVPKTSSPGSEKLIRAIADAVMLNFSLLAGIFANAVWTAATDTTRPRMAEVLSQRLNGYLNTGILITVVGLIVFHFSGFYTRGRFYRGRFKAAIVLQAVAIVFLIATFARMMAPDTFFIPRGAIVTSAVVAAFIILGSRLGSMVWKQLGVLNGRLPAVANERPNHILVIGGAGYVGSALLKKLLRKGYRVRVLDLFMFGDEPLKEVLGHKNLEIVRADFRQVDQVVEAMQGVDAVVHLGAIVGDPACALNEALTIEVNLMATRMIAEVAKASKISRFVFASTCSVYGASDELLDERSRLNPVSLYARSKIASEKVLMGMRDQRFRPTILRFGTVYGLSGRTRFDLVVNLLVAKAYVDRKITVFGADQWRPFVHVEDTALSIMHVLEAPIDVVGNQVFNVGSDGQNQTLGMIGDLVKERVPEAELIVSGTDGDRRNYRVDFSKIRNTLGYKPEWTLNDGVTQILKAFHNGDVEDYQDPRYSNVKFLSADEAQQLVRVDNDYLRSLIDGKPDVPLQAVVGDAEVPAAPARSA